MIKKYSLILMVFLTAIVVGTAQTTIAVQDFDGATPTWNYAINPASYNISSDYWAIRAFNNAPTGTDGDFWAIRDLNNPNGGGAFDHTLTLDNVDVSAYNLYPLTISFRYYTIGFESSDYLRYEVAYDGASFVGATVELLKNTGAWTTVTINAPLGTNNVSLKMIGRQDGGSDYAGWDDFEIIGTPNTPIPTITTSLSSITGLDYIFPGGPSVAQSYTLSAVDLVPVNGDITVTAPPNFEISKTLGGAYANSQTYAYTGGTLAASDVFVRLNAGLPIAVYGPSNITNTGGGATAQNVSVTGSITAGGSGESDIISVPGSETPILSSLINTPGPLNSTEGAPVWQFLVRDGGAGLNDADILPTILTDFVITQYTGNQVTTWSDAIESIDLFNGTTWLGSGTVTANQIAFSGLNFSVADDTQETLSLRLSLKCPLGPDAFDREDFVFGVTNANITFSGAGSGKGSFPTQFSLNGQNTINVLATELQFTVQPINTGLNSTMTDVVVTAVDICGNVNTTFTGSVSITSTGTMTGAPISVNAVAGVATFTNIIVHTAIGTGYTLTASAGFGFSPEISTPFDITPVTVLNPGDLAILAVNTNTGSGDQIAFVIFRDITAGTRIYLTDNGYERQFAGLWGNTEGVIYMTRIGPDLPAGTIIVIEGNGTIRTPSDFAIYTCGNAVEDTNWTKGTITGNGASGFDLNPDDDVWIMQGGIWTNGNTPNQTSTYTGGNVLYGWTESGWQTAPGGGSQSTRWSTIYPGLECFNTVAPTGPGKVKFNDPIDPDFSTTTNARLDWISLINTTANWDTYADNTAYNSGGYDYKGNTTCPALTIATNTYVDGKWTGNADENWFNCSNWDTLEVPDETIDVIVTDNTFNRGAIIDGTAVFASYYAGVAKANNLTITGEKVEIVNSTTSNVLEIHGDLLIDNPNGFLDMSTALADDKIFLYGNWRNNVGTLGFDEGNGTVDFTGTTDQVITNGATPIPPIATEEFYNVIINNDFNTSISNDLYMHGNLTVIGGNTLTVTDGRYVYVNLGVANNGIFNINNNGSLVQGDDSGVNSGNISMDRIASIRRLDYVYWSSPITNFTVDNISPGTPTNLIYRWNPTIPNPSGSQGNWVSANGETMAAGVGYIVRGPSSFDTTLQNHTATFTGGVPLNGVIPVTVSRGSLLGEDDNWNLVGNPYPSAIDAYSFLTHAPNNNLDGFVYLWTHGTLPSTLADNPFYDDFGSNYSAIDYVPYNAMGMSSGIGDLLIGAGQSFMVNVIDGATAANYDIEFTNAMRNIAYDNSQFYRTSKKSSSERTLFAEEKHRIWLDLVSEAQGTNRILVGYAENATMARDRMYDAIADVQSSQGFYSIIADKGFAIQGRTFPFTDTDVIPLGMQLVEDGGYTIGIGAIDGLFETENQTIYLKDNALGFVHNLTESPYSFAAEAGVINDRFEIVFTTQSLSVDEQEQLSNGLTIVELQDGSIKFTISNGLDIKNVKIYDTLGRLLYNLEGNNSTEIYNVSNLSQATYIAQVTLSNDVVITKKAVKRN